MNKGLRKIEEKRIETGKEDFTWGGKEQAGSLPPLFPSSVPPGWMGIAVGGDWARAGASLVLTPPHRPAGRLKKVDLHPALAS